MAIYIYHTSYLYIFIYKVNHRLVSTTLLAKSKHLWVTRSLISALKAGELHLAAEISVHTSLEQLQNPNTDYSRTGWWVNEIQWDSRRI
jgi:hypothetical protein